MIPNNLTNFYDNETLRVLLALLPGLVTVAIVHALTVREKLAPLERIIQALLYTFLNHVFWQITVVLINLNCDWKPSINGNLIGLFLCGAFLGLAMTLVINHDWLHGLLRYFRITKRTSRPNEWYDAFYRWREYVVVHLKDGRRLFGWPRLYPDTATEGHLILEDAEWLFDKPQYSPAVKRLHIMIPVGSIEFVEFVPRDTHANGEQNNVQQSIDTQS